MQYLILLYSAPDAGPEPGSPEHAAEFAKWMGYTQSMAEAGVLVAGDALHPVETATTVRIRDGKTLTTDGPFAETKEHLGGYYLIDVDGLDAAMSWAEQAPLVGYGSVELRPVMVFDS